jgi:hypothetical protein
VSVGAEKPTACQPRQQVLVLDRGDLVAIEREAGGLGYRESALGLAGEGPDTISGWLC